MPDFDQLTKAKEVRALINTRPPALEASGRILYVAGRAKETPVALVVENNKPIFKGTPKGDGRVPWATGIPTGIPTWYMDAKHGDLANHEPAFGALSELIRTGDTDQLSRHEPATARGIPDQFDMQSDEIQIYPGEKEIKAWALDTDVETSRMPRARKIKLRITHGNLAFSRNPVMVGHYQGDGLFSAERYLDKCLGGQLSHCHKLGLYPGPLDTAELMMSKDGTKPQGALIVGLGDVGKLTVPTLSRTISKALHRYAFDIAKHDKENSLPSSRQRPLSITSLLVGASTGGLSLQDALISIMRGAMDANRTLEALDKSKGRLFIDELQIIELWEDNAILAASTLDYLFQLNSAFREAFNYDYALEQVEGGQSRAYYAAEPGWWNRLQIQEMEDGSLNFHAISDRARTEKRLVAVDRDKVDQFLSNATASTWTDRQLPKTLFEMLIPNDLKDTSDKLGDTVLMVDEKSARYPWELLEDRLSYSGKPPAVQNRIIRQLESFYFRHDPQMSPGDTALIIGEPRTKLNRLWSPLPGAASEAQLVAGLLESEGRFSVTKLINKDSGDILQVIYQNDYRILHLAGHGVHEFNLKQVLTQLGMDDEASGAEEKVSGMVIGDTVFLNQYDIEQMRRVPELVFINCCHLGKMGATKDRENFPALAANLATQFIGMGARAVVASGWAVDDAAAKTFADVFYKTMIAGKEFGEAVYEARTAVYDRHGEVNTWGAYQCYGDPQYSLQIQKPWSQSQYERPQTPNDLIERLSNLGKAAATATDSEGKDKLKQLEELVDRRKNLKLKEWEKIGRVCASIGSAYGELDQFDKAIAWYRKASATEDASVSIKAFEQCANLQVRLAVSAAKAADSQTGYEKAQKQILEAVDILDRIDTVAALVQSWGDAGDAATTERECLRGSAYRRLALVLSMGGASPKDVREALQKMKKHYKKASDIYLDKNHGEPHFYPYTSFLVASTVLGLYQASYKGMAPEERDTLEKLSNNADSTDRKDPSFWSMVSATDCKLILSINDGTLPQETASIVEGYLTARKRGATPRQFRSVIESLEVLIHLIKGELGAQKSRSRRSKINDALVEIIQQLVR